METLWFCLVAFMIAGYVVLDGFDIGAGIIHNFAAKDDHGRRKILASIGPVWDGNEVWLLAGGGTLYFAFPKLYASSFAGFYLPLMMVLWLLIFRALAIEFRNHIASNVWRPFWDVAFGGASTLLAVFFGAALGNVVRGVSLDKDGDFFLPLWTDFRVGADVGILDWYTILVGVLAALTLTLHGSLWVAYKTDGEVRERAHRYAQRAWYGTAGLTLLVTAATFAIQPQVPANFGRYPFGVVFPLLAVAGLAGVLLYLRPETELRAFLASCVFLLGMLTSAAFGIFPFVLPSSSNPELGLTIYNTATTSYGLKVGLAWWIPGMLLATGYFVFIYRRFAGKVRLEDSGH
jgi:cytochrome d ubiquinol oxidase subunit II